MSPTGRANPRMKERSRLPHSTEDLSAATVLLPPLPPLPPKPEVRVIIWGWGVSRKASPINQQQRGPPQHPHLSLHHVTSQTASPGREESQRKMKINAPQNEDQRKQSESSEKDTRNTPVNISRNI